MNWQRLTVRVVVVVQIDELRMESEMPLEELLAKYRSVSGYCSL